MPIKLRRLRGDLINIYRSHKNFKVFTEDDDKVKTRSVNNRPKIMNEPYTKCNMRQNILFNRVASTWNKLPFNVVNAENQNVYKNKLDKHLKSKFRMSIYRT